jgi:acetyl-CoA carboxylase biotin carboxyl carrier protein
VALTDDDVREILRIIDESELDELLIESEGFSLHVRKGAGSDFSPAAAGAVPPGDALPTRAAPGGTAPSASETGGAPLGSAAAEPAEEGVVVVESPMLGTFYRAEAPGAAPFVEVGSAVEPGATLCIIEVMKMMNSVVAEVSGTVVEVCAENGHLVEYGQPLVRVRAR